MSSTAAPAEHPRRIGLIMTALMMTMLLAALDQTIVSTALPTIVSDLKGLNQYSWVVTAYLLTSTASTPIWGKLSDMIGRKLILQSAVIVFLVGSVLAGMAQTMWQLILTRGIQGLGGGGLMVLVLAVIADVIPPRERGRYTGIFTGVFGFASIIGPLLGGFFTQHLSWRWIFYINIPLGIAALLVIGAVLHIPVTHKRVAIDWLGAGLLIAGVTTLLLVTEWGGQKYAWGSTTILVLSAAGLISIVLFVLQEFRAPDPIVSMKLFRNVVFTTTSAIGFVVGFAMFGSIIFLSLYLQIVHGATPTMSGLQLLPMMLGIMISSIGSGQLIVRIGHYKPFPIIGTGLAAVGLYLLSYLSPTLPYWKLSIAMFILGFGMGNVMQVLVLAVQNAVDVTLIGAATSGSTFFRSIGGSFGTAVFGALMTSRLASELAKAIPPDVAAKMPHGSITSSMAGVAKLAEPLHTAVVGAFARAISHTFLVASIVMAVGFAISWFIPENPLRTHHGPAPTTAEESSDVPAVSLD
ncbi:MAG: MDR family MFS transporter [Actinomycetes bacterium]